LELLAVPVTVEANLTIPNLLNLLVMVVKLVMVVSANPLHPLDMDNRLVITEFQAPEDQDTVDKLIIALPSQSLIKMRLRIYQNQEKKCFLMLLLKAPVPPSLVMLI